MAENILLVYCVKRVINLEIVNWSALEDATLGMAKRVQGEDKFAALCYVVYNFLCLMSLRELVESKD